MTSPSPHRLRTPPMIALAFAAAGLAAAFALQSAAQEKAFPSTHTMATPAMVADNPDLF